MQLIPPRENRNCDFCLNQSKYDLLIVAPNGSICSSCVSLCVITLAGEISKRMGAECPVEGEKK